ncbi:unnamed protein product [Caenorhabditis auriculariae]|uniref:Protein kinase domain-containing protein n=1 Tax=Caenorhabditis auriculariae TaxID=2777116 RepID=A0A8S1H2K6_9PELO|nr:unnamed protein product [Caenorhabditis auriculariae]
MADGGNVELAKGKIVGCKWQVMKKLGEGGCGAVYLVKSVDSQDTYAAMKAESNNATGGCVLKLEVAILRKLSRKPHVTQLFCSARNSQFSYMVMTLLGDSLNKISRRLGRIFSVSTQVRIGANILFCLKQIHDIGYIHRDLKPANIALGFTGTAESRFFHILDFGLARQYAVTSEDEPERYKLRRPRERALFRGTTRYCSVGMHDRAEQGRVDDLWSMLYLLAELRGPLPWSSFADKKVVGEQKRLYSDDALLQNSPTEMLEIAQYLRTLTYYNRPDYLKIYNLFLSIMDKGKFKWSDPFDWELLDKKKEKRSLSKALTPTRSVSKEPPSRAKTPTRSKPVASKEAEMASRMDDAVEQKTVGTKEHVGNDTILPFKIEDFTTNPIGF